MRLAAAPPLSASAGRKTRRALALGPANALDYAIHFRIIHREPGGRHGERPDAQQQGKEEAEAGQEQGQGCPGPLAVRRHAQPDQSKAVRQEIAGAARQTPSPARGGSTREARRGGVVRRVQLKPALEAG